ncbi:hypothetical protein JKF63_05420 [Porcisia hertigi]|uniref:Uncharacterized protein n=1 Tax=Porcisia hertigi TaxID=2761500 RepID=A0A836IVX3_9TRYP|nr:hypothetical protein JKF63_05420 [Porcisia hertigi]
MSFASKVNAYRELKRIASENCHLYARLLSNIEVQSSSRRVTVSFSGLHVDPLPQNRKYLFTGKGMGRDSLFQTSVRVPLHHRCSLNVGESSAASQQEAELGAIVEALAVASSSTEWARIMRVLDSDLFISFLRLLTTLNAYALIRVTRAQSPRATSAPRHKSLPRETQPQFRATVAVDLPSVDDADAALGTQKCEDAADNISLRGRASDPRGKPFQHWQHSRQYDVGVIGDWAPSVRDAIKVALFKSLDVLQAHAVAEWRDAGREGALLLNELAYGGCCTSEMDVGVLNSALRSGNVVSSSLSAAQTEHQLLRFRCVAFSDSVSVTAISVGCTPKGHQTKPTCVPLGGTAELGLFAAPSSAVSLVASGPVTFDEIRLPFSVTAAHIQRPFVDRHFCRSQPAVKELLWPCQCIAGATLLLLASIKASLYRDSISTCTDAFLQEASISSAPCRSPGVSAFEWHCVPFFSIFCAPALPERDFFFPHDPWDVKSDTTLDLSAQNHWHYPDVVAMIGLMRADLHLPLKSYPKIMFEQTALHDPARRAQALSQGLYGDVDVLTRVHVRWETPRGCFAACAASEPTLHHRYTIRCGARVSPRTRLSCADTGYPRGPLLLLIAAVCSLYDQVFGRATPAAEGCYPLVPVKASLSQGGLDYLLYSWFEASPQVRCFTISTASLNAAERSMSEVTAIPDGSTRHEIGSSMTRAMLFYDILGQRVLFAETHAASSVDAVRRVSLLAEEQNCMGQDMFASSSAAAQRAFRSVSQQQQWQRARDHLERFLQLQCEVADRTRADDMAMTSTCSGHGRHHRSIVAELVRACIGSCASEACALWTVLAVVAKLATTRTGAASEDNDCGHQGGPYAYRPLSARFWTDCAQAADLSAREGGSESDREWWLGMQDVTWNCKALGEEAVPPRAGVMEMQLCVGASLVAAAAAAATAKRQTATVEVVVLRCRVDALRSVREVSEAEWSCEELLTESPSLGRSANVILTTTLVASGVIPALALLCRRALEYIYSEARCAPLSSILPPLSDVLAWCAAAAPMFGGPGSGYPPYDARFYAAPKLLGELLQGAAGKYRCSYNLLPLPDPLTSAASGAGGGEGYVNAAQDDGVTAMTSAQPSTIFYTSKPVKVDASALGAATRGQCGSCLTEPPFVACTLYLESLFGNAASLSVLAVPPTCSAPTAAPFVLGHGVGRTKREAWRSAAWQALRLQFPVVLAHLEAYRDASKLLQRPEHLNRLVRSSGLGQNGTRHRVAPVVYKLNFDCSEFSHSSLKSTSAGATGAASMQSRRQSKCQVTAVRTDGSKVCVVPGSTATAASAGEAYTVAVAAVLRAVRSDAQGVTKDEAKVTMSTAPAQPAWAAAWPSAPGFVDGPTGSRHYGSYASWRETTHYGKSVWHAYAGALSAYLESDVMVHLVGAEDTRADFFASSSHGVGGERKRRRRVLLSKVQVRMQSWRVGAATGAGNVALRFNDQKFAAFDRITPFEAPVASARLRPLGSGGSDAAEGILFEHTAAFFLTRSWSSLGTGAQRTQADTITTAALLPSDHSLRLLQEITRWLSATTQQCALPLAVREELQGLLCARSCDVARIQESYRWSPAERVEALLKWWLGRRAQVRIRRVNSGAAASSSLANQAAWVAEALVELEAECRCPDSRSSSHAGFSTYSNLRILQKECDGLESQASTRRFTAYPWVAARAVGHTSDRAAWQLYQHVCDALRDVVATEPSSSPPPLPERR